MYSYITSYIYIACIDTSAKIVKQFINKQTQNKMITEEIKGTPFQVVVTDDKKVFVALGNQAVLFCKSKKEAINKVLQRDYELLINTMFIVKQFKTEDHETETNKTTEE